MKILANFSRIFTGLVFMFSGFAKGDDPLGFSYKLEDYFIAYGIDFLIPAGLVLTIILCTLEFTIGVMLLLNLRMKLTSWLLLLMMAYFTGLTFIDALTNPVPDCGCFGDAIKLTNWQTFYKNVVLILLAIIVFLYRKKFTGLTRPAAEWSLAGLFAVIFAVFSTYCYLHLPVVDFTEWKKGNKLYAENPKPVKFYLSYKNKSSGEITEYLSPDYPYNDSSWMANHEFVSQRADDPNEFAGKSLVIMDTTQAAVTESITRYPGYQLVVNAYDLKSTNRDAFRQIAGLWEKLSPHDYQLAVIVSDDAEGIRKFSDENSLKLDFYISDDILLKTMVRSNPGMMLLKNGVIIEKWHWRDLPEAGEFIKRFPAGESQ